jgi:hypothetical protein
MLSSGPLSSRRRWVSLTAATIVLQFSYWPIIGSLGAGEAGDAGLLWLGLAVVPFVFLVLAFTSGHPRAPGATGLAMGLFLLIALPVALLDLLVGLVAGFGAGAVLALRFDPERHSRRGRAIAVTAASVYTLALVLLQHLLPVLGPFAVVSGAVIPLAVVGIADEAAEGLLEHEREHRVR